MKGLGCRVQGVGYGVAAAAREWEEEALVANRHVKVADQVMLCPFKQLSYR